MKRMIGNSACALLFVLMLGACAPQQEAAAPAETSAGAETAAPAVPATDTLQPGAATSETTMDIGGKVWLVSEIAGEKVVTPADARQPFFQFDTAQKFVSGFSGCNTFRGGYESEGSALKFGALASTKMACLGDGDKLEFAMNQALVKVAGFAIQGNELTLTGSDGAVLFRCQTRAN